MSEQPQEKKIIIDEDWKLQVQAEKEAARQPEGVKPAEPAATAGSVPGDFPLPPASLEILIASLATQAMVALGILPNPLTKKRDRMPNQAKHLIDLLGVLQAKTEGNRTAEESEVLDNTLHDLRMAYVSVLQGRGVSDA